MKSNNFLPEEYIFCLDIGTRNVVGMIAKIIDDNYSIVDYEIVSHPERAMYDGQIHDINRVVKVVKEIVFELEKRNEVKLNEVAIAAAGRALKTKDVTVERELDYSKTIKKELLDNIEMEGIQNAQEILDSESDIKTRYYCVGYSAKNYYLEGNMIKTPIDHRGKSLKVEIIATFLPHVVVDSLYTVIDKAGLEVANLTLEPIAAINVAIPDKLRMLNLALVDIGAGTSDIALTKAGTIISYGMVSQAGDSITDILVQEFLLDFDEAEKLKLELMNKDKLEFSDIVGIKHEKTREEILGILDKSLDDLSDKIANEIIEKNSKNPSAVFCIGGGCQVPTFTERLAKKLDLPNERVVIKGVEIIENIDFGKKELEGPEYITPIGIGYNGLMEKEKDFLQVTVNGKKMRLFNSKKLSVSHALILVGFNARKLLAQRGEKIMITVNGEKKVINGEYGESADIYINGVIANLDTKIKNKDSIYVEEAKKGKKRKMKIKKYFDLSKNVFLDGREYKLIKSIKINNQSVDNDYIIKDNDVIEIDQIKSLENLCDYANIDMKVNYFTIDNEKIENDYILKKGDEINQYEIDLAESNSFKEKEYLNDLTEKNIEIDNNRVFEEEKVQEKNMYFVVNGSTIEVKAKKEMVFVDIFEHIDFDLRTAKGILDLRLNDDRAKYTDVLKSGDKIDIKWR